MKYFLGCKEYEGIKVKVWDFSRKVFVIKGNDSKVYSKKYFSLWIDFLFVFLLN